MNGIHPDLRRYVEEIARQLQAKECRDEIMEELSGHLEELMESRKAEGANDEEAARWAVAQMGETREVAHGLNRVHRPRVPWSMLGALAAVLAIAIVSLFSVQTSFQGRGGMEGVDFVGRHALFIGIGSVLLFAFSLIRYRRLLCAPLALYGATVALMAAAFVWGPQINGASKYLQVGPILLNVMQASPYLLIVSAAGALVRSQDRWRDVIRHTVCFTAVPIALLVKAPSFSDLFLYSSAYAFLLLVSGKSRRWAAAHILLSAGAFAAYLAASWHGRLRLEAYLDRYDASSDAAYMYIKIDEALRSAGWLGHGFGAAARQLPYIYSETILTYLIYSLGWAFGLLSLLVIAWFVALLIRAASSVKDPFGRLLAVGLGAVLTIQFVWSIGMSLGLLPIIGVTLPLISYGGSALLAQFAAIGIICGVYVRKDMVPFAASH
ncbi:FtsW/RodA/SpoVE family cell cycle protein [Paenibacillus sp.]|uniref:FtsW/RodA/SpoVE family cell cycle protein n=1 Tax=Paenibacillus sp. TaxID=58172 RepID=UPI0028121EE1|nr:FtsW/RodA/SpoVE family cell cycle protein [Paenibacillus sp.]